MTNCKICICIYLMHGIYVATITDSIEQYGFKNNNNHAVLHSFILENGEHENSTANNYAWHIPKDY